MTSLPIPFIKRMQAQLGQEFEDFQASLDTIPPVSIRLNPNKNGQVPNQELYDGQIPWCSDAYYLKKRPTFILTRIFTGVVITCRKPPPCSCKQSYGNFKRTGLPRHGPWISAPHPEGNQHSLPPSCLPHRYW